MFTPIRLAIGFLFWRRRHLREGRSKPGPAVGPCGRGRSAYLGGCFKRRAGWRKNNRRGGRRVRGNSIFHRMFSFRFCFIWTDASSEHQSPQENGIQLKSEVDDGAFDAASLAIRSSPVGRGVAYFQTSLLLDNNGRVNAEFRQEVL